MISICSLETKTRSTYRQLVIVLVEVCLERLVLTVGFISLQGVITNDNERSLLDVVEFSLGHYVELHVHEEGILLLYDGVVPSSFGGKMISFMSLSLEEGDKLPFRL